MLMNDHRACATSAGTALPDRSEASQNHACAASHQSKKTGLPLRFDAMKNLVQVMPPILTKICDVAEAVRNAG